MNLVKAVFQRFVTTALLCCVAIAQQAVPPAQVSVVPRLLNFSGRALDSQGKVLSGTVGATFAIYKDQDGGAALWLETQNVSVDAKGNYTVQLGATKPDGLPLDLFTSGEGRWLGVTINGETELPRILLLSVPYALKAADAETIGGLPPSAFVLAAPPNAANSSASAASPVTSSVTPPPPTTSNVTTSGGTVNALPLWTTATNVQSSAVAQAGTGTTSKIGINTTKPASTLDVNGTESVRGNLSLPSIGTATATAGKNSQPISMSASAFNSGTATAVPQNFRLQAEPAGNNTASTSGTLNLLYGFGTNTPAETGFKLGSNGRITFAAGQTFPGIITAINTAAASGLTGGGSSGPLNLSLKSCATNQILQWNGTAWACANLVTGSVTSIALSAPSSDFVVSGSPITTTGTLGLAWTVPPDTNDTPNAIVKRDASGNISVGGVTSTALTVSTVSGESDVQPTYISTTGTMSAGDVKFYNGQFLGEAAPYGSLFNGTDGVYAVGGAGDPSINTSVSADGVDAYGGDDNNLLGFAGYGGTGVFGQGGEGTVQDGPGGYFQGGNHAGLGQGIVAVGGSDIGGYFSGAIYSTGTITGTKKNFKIDHPLDPANKYLVHSSIESSEDMNLYTGNVTTDGQGEATVSLPDWFEALNTDFRYQLTVIGRFAQAIVSREIQDHRFSIRTSLPNVRVSWLITGVRHDAYVKAHPLVVEEAKAERDRGSYINPELFGAPLEKSITWVRYHHLMERAKARPVAKPRAKPASKREPSQTPK